MEFGFGRGEFFFEGGAAVGELLHGLGNAVVVPGLGPEVVEEVAVFVEDIWAELGFGGEFGGGELAGGGVQWSSG